MLPACAVANAEPWDEFDWLIHMRKLAACATSRSGVIGKRTRLKTWGSNSVWVRIPPAAPETSDQVTSDKQEQEVFVTLRHLGSMNSLTRHLSLFTCHFRGALG